MVTGLLDDHTYCARSVFTHAGLWQKLYSVQLFIASLRNQQMHPKMFSIYIFCHLPTGGLEFDRGLFGPQFEGQGGHGRRGGPI